MRTGKAASTNLTFAPRAVRHTRSACGVWLEEVFVFTVDLVDHTRRPPPGVRRGWHAVLREATVTGSRSQPRLGPFASEREALAAGVELLTMALGKNGWNEFEVTCRDEPSLAAADLEALVEAATAEPALSRALMAPPGRAAQPGRRAA